MLKDESETFAKNLVFGTEWRPFASLRVTGIDLDPRVAEGYDY